MNVNVSPVQLRRPDFVPSLEGVLERTAFPPERLVLELTESALIDDMQNAEEKLHAIRSLGVRICVDDFGTGHASLEYLLSLPVDIVKIDRHFIANIVADRRSGAIVRAAGLLANELGFRVIAEGVESVEQAREVLAAGHEYAQGYLFGAPVPAEAWRAGEVHVDPDVIAAWSRRAA
jgi:Amt family ammonium transporter